MKTFKDEGIAFKKLNINEADVIFSIITKYHGRIDTIAKGIRKPTSRKAGNIDIMTLSRFHFAKGKNLDIITEAALIDDYKKLKKKLKSTMSLFYICELLDNFVQIGEDSKKIYKLLIELLKTLSRSKNKLPINSFELKLISNQGFEPNLYTCLKCNKDFNNDSKRYLAYDKLGFYCENERNIKKASISDKAIKTLRFLISNRIKDSLTLLTDSKLEREIEEITKRWLEQILEKEIKSAKYIDK